MNDDKIIGKGNNKYQKKMWSNHQANEYKKVTNDNEAICFGCFTKSACNATIADICGDCAGKKGREALLAVVAPKYYGLCFFCNTYKFNMEQINARLCMSCHRRVADITKAYNTSGGLFNNDPFWKHLKKKHGNDWRKVLSEGGTRKMSI